MGYEVDVGAEVGSKSVEVVTVKMFGMNGVAAAVEEAVDPAAVVPSTNAGVDEVEVSAVVDCESVELTVKAPLFAVELAVDVANNTGHTVAEEATDEPVDEEAVVVAEPVLKGRYAAGVEDDAVEEVPHQNTAAGVDDDEVAIVTVKVGTDGDDEAVDIVVPDVAIGARYTGADEAVVVVDVPGEGPYHAGALVTEDVEAIEAVAVRKTVTVAVAAVLVDVPAGRYTGDPVADPAAAVVLVPEAVPVANHRGTTVVVVVDAVLVPAGR
ncbi:hypothetical protein HK101_006679 [Irineochytrium annulatum]|nr:hypothetical protein HK101_006679 [Irineochytrium annulatum]